MEYPDDVKSVSELQEVILLREYITKIILNGKITVKFVEDIVNRLSERADSHGWEIRILNAPTSNSNSDEQLVLSCIQQYQKVYSCTPVRNLFEYVSQLCAMYIGDEIASTAPTPDQIRQKMNDITSYLSVLMLVRYTNTGYEMLDKIDIQMNYDHEGKRVLHLMQNCNASLTSLVFDCYEPNLFKKLDKYIEKFNHDTEMQNDGGALSFNMARKVLKLCRIATFYQFGLGISNHVLENDAKKRMTENAQDSWRTLFQICRRFYEDCGEKVYDRSDLFGQENEQHDSQRPVAKDSFIQLCYHKEYENVPWFKSLLERKQLMDIDQPNTPDHILIYYLYNIDRHGIKMATYLFVHKILIAQLKKLFNKNGIVWFMGNFDVDDELDPSADITPSPNTPPILSEKEWDNMILPRYQYTQISRVVRRILFKLDEGRHEQVNMTPDKREHMLSELVKKSSSSTSLEISRLPRI
jgi:hypothetical protein